MRGQECQQPQETAKCYPELVHSAELVHSDKKKLNHQGEFLVTGLQRQVLIELLRISKHVQPFPSISDHLMCLFTRQKEKSSLTKLAPVCFKKYLSECVYQMQIQKIEKKSNIKKPKVSHDQIFTQVYAWQFKDVWHQIQCSVRSFFPKAFGQFSIEQTL